ECFRRRKRVSHESQMRNPCLAYIACSPGSATSAGLYRITRTIMHSSEPITLNRSCDAVEIPAGIPHTLPAGAVVRLMQELGGSYSVIAESGRMYRLNAEDADALGLSVKATEQASASTQGELNEKLIWHQLKTVYDPEIPVNIPDLV